MSEYAGELKVRIVPDASGFGPDLQREMASQQRQVSPRVQALLQRSGLDKAMQQNRRTTLDLIRANQQLANAEQSSANQALASRRAYGLLGIAVVAGYQAIGQLQRSLRVTGAEAATTEGRLRNVGAALLGGDVLGAFKAARTEFTLTADALRELQSEIARGNTLNVDKLRQAAEVFGNDKLRAQLSQASFAVRTNLQQDRATAAGLTPGLRDDLAAARVAEREARIGVRVFQKGTDEYSKAFAAWAGAVKQRRAIVQRIEGQTSPELRDAARQQQFQLNQLRAAGTKSTRDDMDIAKTRADYLRRLIGQLEKDDTKTKAQKARLVTLYGQLDQVESSLEQVREQARAAQQERVQKQIAAAQVDLQIQAANARGQAQETAALRSQADFAAREATDKRLAVDQRQQFALEAAQLNKQLYDIQVRQAEEAKQAAQRAREARKQELEAERQRYRDGLALDEQRIQLRVQAAQLTGKKVSDDKRALRALIAFYKQEERDQKLTVQERLTAQSNKISAQLQLRNLAKQKKTSSTASGMSAADFFAEAASQFRTYGSNITADRSGILSGQDARARYAQIALAGRGPSLTTGLQALGVAAASSANEAVTHTVLLRGILRAVSGGVGGNVAPSGTAQTKTAQRARAAALRSGGGV